MSKRSSVLSSSLALNSTSTSENFSPKFLSSTSIRHWLRLKTKSNSSSCKNWLKKTSLTGNWIGWKGLCKACQGTVRLWRSRYRSTWGLPWRRLRSRWRLWAGAKVFWKWDSSCSTKLESNEEAMKKCEFEQLIWYNKVDTVLYNKVVKRQFNWSNFIYEKILRIALFFPFPFLNRSLLDACINLIFWDFEYFQKYSDSHSFHSILTNHFGFLVEQISLVRFCQLIHSFYFVWIHVNF